MIIAAWIIAAAWLLPAVWFFGYLSQTHKKQSRWWVNLVVALGWPLGWAFGIYLRRRIKRK